MGVGSDRGTASFDLVASVRSARRSLPPEHRALLDHLNAQETALYDWPQEVCDLFVTLGERPPPRERLAGAAAVWLEARRLVAFNAPLLTAATEGLDERSRDAIVARVAWHEYGHALSVMRAARDQRADGPRLLRLLPDGLRGSIDHPGGYRAVEVFDEVIANVYALMIARVCDGRYGDPEFLHPDVLDAFKEVIPWPPSH
jgi:hypothetical protein